MKSSVLKWYMFAFLFLSEFVMFAQDGETDPGSGAEDETTSPLEATDAPINSRLVILAIAAIVFSIYYFRKNKQVTA